VYAAFKPPSQYQLIVLLTIALWENQQEQFLNLQLQLKVVCYSVPFRLGSIRRNRQHTTTTVATNTTNTTASLPAFQIVQPTQPLLTFINTTTATVTINLKGCLLPLRKEQWGSNTKQ
jgi:hypothetical protein